VPPQTQRLAACDVTSGGVMDRPDRCAQQHELDRKWVLEGVCVEQEVGSRGCVCGTGSGF